MERFTENLSVFLWRFRITLVLTTTYVKKQTLDYSITTILDQLRMEEYGFEILNWSSTMGTIWEGTFLTLFSFWLVEFGWWSSVVGGDCNLQPKEALCKTP